MKLPFAQSFTLQSNTQDQLWWNTFSSEITFVIKISPASTDDATLPNILYLFITVDDFELKLINSLYFVLRQTLLLPLSPCPNLLPQNILAPLHFGPFYQIQN